MKQNTLRRAAALALAAGLTLACGLPAAAAAPNPDPGKAVIDTADILSKSTENYITDLSVALQESCGAQIGVYTVDTIGNYTMEGYTYELANAWGLGDADKDNGIVLVLAPGEDDYRAMCGTGLETQFTVPMLQTILDENLLPSWEEGDYDTGAKQTVRAMGRQLCTIYGLSIDLDDPAATVTTTAASGPVRRGGGFPFGAIVLLLLVLVVVLAIIFAPRGPTRPHGPRFIFFGAPRAPRPPRPPRPPCHRRRPPRPPRPPKPPRPPRSGGFGGFGGSGPRPPRSGGFRSGGGGFRSGGAGRRPGGGSFRSGGGSFRGGGAGRR